MLKGLNAVLELNEKSQRLFLVVHVLKAFKSYFQSYK